MNWKPELDETRAARSIRKGNGRRRQGQAAARSGPADRARAHRQAARSEKLSRDRRDFRRWRICRERRTDLRDAGQLRVRPRQGGGPSPSSSSGDDFTVRGGSADASIWAKPTMAEQMAHDFRLPIIRVIEGLRRRRVGENDRDQGRGQSARRHRRHGVVLVHDGETWRACPSSASVLGSVAGLGAARLAASHYSVHDEIIRDVCRRAAGGGAARAIARKAGAWRLADPDQGRRRRSCRRDRRRGPSNARENFLSYLPSSVFDLPPTIPCDDDPERADEALLNAVPRSRKQVYKMRPHHRVGGGS